MAKTIKQIADELRVSKQQVYRYIKRNHISEAHQKNGVMYYDEAAETAIKRGFSDKAVSSEVHQEVHQKHISDAVNDAVNDAVVITLQTLQEQLTAKDKLIEQLQTELATERQHSREQADKLSVLADQAQKLQLAQLASSEQQASALIEDSKLKPKQRKWAFWKK